ncbi:hypothetical protein Pst134EA_029050 [Puccinia striiformis f. sp. tritici]|uniref:hypothetical protein n=1 Tax=Puccinia striiformis f. sp. tritici TaxID=168172 RepID=UPI002008DEB4|nr:hypothetical protein Pst134EA_029050 [Puccinia striiformis f. sp. tritici]KAH9447065.1 hypothetical protein Pst134EA_029050 [Puccinia striiformis f. sp. tritici]
MLACWFFLPRLDLFTRNRNLCRLICPELKISFQSKAHRKYTDCPAEGFLKSGGREKKPSDPHIFKAASLLTTSYVQTRSLNTYGNEAQMRMLYSLFCVRAAAVPRRRSNGWMQIVAQKHKNMETWWISLNGVNGTHSGVQWTQIRESESSLSTSLSPSPHPPWPYSPVAAKLPLRLLTLGSLTRPISAHWDR